MILQFNVNTHGERSVAIKILPNCGSAWIDYITHQYLFHFYKNSTIYVIIVSNKNT